jgi:hypothetical protein
MQRHLLRASMFASSAIMLHVILSRISSQRKNFIIPVFTSEKLITLAESLRFTIENRMPFRTDSPDTVLILISAIEMLINYDRLDVAANYCEMDSLQAEALQTRINDCMLLKQNLENVLKN